MISEQILGNSVSKHDRILRKKNFAYTISTMLCRELILGDWQKRKRNLLDFYARDKEEVSDSVWINVSQVTRGTPHHFCTAHKYAQ